MLIDMLSHRITFFRVVDRIRVSGAATAQTEAVASSVTVKGCALLSKYLVSYSVQRRAHTVDQDVATEQDDCDLHP